MNLEEKPAQNGSVATLDVPLSAPATPQDSCRTNSRRGMIDPGHRSYPPVEAVRRAFRVLRAVNKLGIATINGIFGETQIPKPTIVRMLETLMAEGYVARDNMCGGYRITRQVEELNSGYSDTLRVIEVSLPFAVDLTRRIKWPIGLGVIDGDAIDIQFWTGSISPWAHRSTVLGLRPDFISSAMGRAHLAFCTPDQLDAIIKKHHETDPEPMDENQERHFRSLLQDIRRDGFSKRDPRTKPYRTTTLAMPISQGGQVQAVVSISFYKSAVPYNDIEEQIVQPLRAMTTSIEQSLAFMKSGHDEMDRVNAEDFEHGF